MFFVWQQFSVLVWSSKNAKRSEGIVVVVGVTWIVVDLFDEEDETHSNVGFRTHLKMG